MALACSHLDPAKQLELLEKALVASDAASMLVQLNSLGQIMAASKGNGGGDDDDEGGTMMGRVLGTIQTREVRALNLFPSCLSLLRINGKGFFQGILSN